MAVGILDGRGGDDTLLGGQGAETLWGEAGDDEILGAGGNDLIDGGLGADLLDGGEGFDLLSYASLASPVLVDLQSPWLNIGDAADDELLNFEGVIGTGGADTLYGNAVANEVRGGLGNDVLDGRVGTDTLRGGLGDDLMMVDNAGDRVIEGVGQGADTVMASVSFQLAANAAIEVLTTTNAAGTTAISLTGSALSNTLIGNAGVNRLNGRDGTDHLSGLAGADTLLGGNGADTLLGGADDDQLFGDADADRLDGGDGNDRLTGGVGNDTMTGGAGRDLFIFDAVENYLVDPFGVPYTRDVITDFNPVDDTIRLSLSVFGDLGVAGQLAANAFLKVAGGEATLASHRIIYDPTTGNVFYDFNGDAPSAGTVLIAVLENLPATVTAGDFVIIA